MIVVFLYTNIYILLSSKRSGIQYQESLWSAELFGKLYVCPEVLCSVLDQVSQDSSVGPEDAINVDVTLVRTQGNASSGASVLLR